MNKECQALHDEAQQLFNQPKKALKIGKALMAKGKEASDYEAVAYGHYVMGSAMFVLGKEQGLMSHATQAVAYFREVDNKTMLIKSLNLQGIAYTASDEFQMALVTYKEAYDLVMVYETSRYRKDIILSNIGATYFSLGEHKRAVRIMEKLYKRMHKHDKQDPSFVFNTVYNLADFHCEMEETEKALEYVLESEKLLETSERQLEALLQGVVATKVYYKLGKLEEANAYSDKVVKLIENGIDSFELHRDYEKIVLMQLDLGEYDRADKYADFLWDEAQKTKNTLDMLRATRMQARYFDLQDNTRMSLYYYRMMDKISEMRNAEMLKSQLNIAKNNELLVKKMKAFQKVMKEKEEMEILANRDPLTGLLNRNIMSKMLEQFVAQSQKEGKPVGCIFMDVDCFKEYNDNYGHVKGDECLKNIADACKSVEGDKVYFIRYGGDEFFALTYGMTNEEIAEKAKNVVKKIRECAMEHKASKVIDKVTVSVGVLNLTMNEHNNILEVVNFTDRALYYSKEHGKNCIHMFDEKFYREKNDMQYIKIDDK